MITHDTLWAAIDALAAKNGLSTSGLAKVAGLDATSFNPCKRISPNGHTRWPSSETMVKVLTALNMTWTEFGRLIDEIYARDAENVADQTGR